MKKIGLSALEIRRKEIKIRRLEIYATLAEWKKDYFEKGIKRPMQDRCALETEDAHLALELHRTGDAANEETARRQWKLKNTELRHLKAVLEERGLHELIELAIHRHEAALRAEKEGGT